MTSREQFEAWMTEMRPWMDLKTFMGGYLHKYVDELWISWQASREQALQEADLPSSYDGSTFSTWGDLKEGAVIRLSFTDANQAERWFEHTTNRFSRIANPEGEPS